MGSEMCIRDRRNYVSCSKVRTALRYKRRCFRALIQERSLSNVAAYERSVEIAQCAITNDTNKRENYIINNTDPKSFWTYVNRRQSKHPGISHITSSGTDIDNPQAIANSFNNYFTSVFTPISDDDTCQAPVTCFNPASLHNISITSNDVYKILKSLPAKTSTDNDGLSYKVLKEGGTILATYLAQLFSLSLDLGRLPDAWKMGVVTPIHKDGPRNLVSNYRPITVTSCCCRILERIIRNRLTDYLSLNGIISDTQHGFVPRRSTDTILLRFYDFITNNVDNNMVIDAIFFDFSKAFDKISHSKLILRLYYNGVSGKILDWIIDFLTHREQKVRIGNLFSYSLPVTSGVIQGSVLGPILFNIFINDIDSVVKHSMILKYADDIRLFSSSLKSDSALSVLKQNLQIDIDNVVDWVSNSGMTFNTSKCFSTTFGSSSVSRRSYSICGSGISYKSSFRDLGVLASTPLSFGRHMDVIISKSFSKLGLIHKIFHNKSQKTIPRLFKAYVRPVLEYSSLIWNPYTIKYINKIERVQRNMCRMIPTIRHLPYREQLRRLGLHSLHLRRQRYQLILIYKLYNRLSDLNFHTFFQISKDKRTRGHKLSIIPKFAKNNYRLKFFTNSSVHLWNQLTNDDVTALNLSDFKKRLESFFLTLDLW